MVCGGFSSGVPRGAFSSKVSRRRFLAGGFSWDSRLQPVGRRLSKKVFEEYFLQGSCRVPVFGAMREFRGFRRWEEDLNFRTTRFAALLDLPAIVEFHFLLHPLWSFATLGMLLFPADTRTSTRIRPQENHVVVVVCGRATEVWWGARSGG